jgi:hypothetical protein
MKLEDKQTAVEWLFSSLWDTPKDKLTWWAIFDEAMAIEKQQIIDAHESSYIEMNLAFRAGERAEQYYDDNYAN